MKKIAMFTLALAGILASAVALFAQGNDQAICHVTGNGGVRLIYVAAQALKAHYAHGDYTPSSDGNGPTCDVPIW